MRLGMIIEYTIRGMAIYINYKSYIICGHMSHIIIISCHYIDYSNRGLYIENIKSYIICGHMSHIIIIVIVIEASILKT